MSDNATVYSGTTGSAIAVATDEVAVNGGTTAHVEYIKLVDGTANGTAGIPGDATNGLDVDVTRVSGTVTVDSELPAASALTDNFSNPTAPGVGSFGMLWDGATWDRYPGTSTDGALVNLGANNDVTVTSGNITADTELPAAAALTDNFSNPTAPGVGAFAMVWDGATWDRLPGTSVDGGLVNLGANNDVTVTGTIAQDVGVSGNPVIVGYRASDAEPTAMSADGDVVYTWADRSGRTVTTEKCGSTAQTSVAGSVSNVTLLSSNTARLGAVINNDSTAILYVKLGTTASTTSYTYKLFPDGVCEIPYGYTGIIDGIWASATGNARITEMS